MIHTTKLILEYQGTVDVHKIEAINLLKEDTRRHSRPACWVNTWVFSHIPYMPTYKISPGRRSNDTIGS
jgi:hypothetical protein